MKKVIVTGATSFLGIELVVRLQNEDVDVHVVIRSESNTKRLNYRAPDTTIHIHDGTQESLINIFSIVRPDTVFHLAGKYIREERQEDIETLFESNITFGSQLLAAASNSGVKSFINTGSYFQFSDKNETPINFYGATKNSFATILDYYAKLNKFLATSLIIFDTYGPGDWRKKLFPNIVKAIENNLPLATPSNETRIYPVHSADVIDCYLLAADLLAKKPENITNRSFAVRDEEPHTIDEIIAAFERIGGKKITIKRGDWPEPKRQIKHTWYGSTLPNWQPKYSLTDGIQSMLED